MYTKLCIILFLLMYMPGRAQHEIAGCLRNDQTNRSVANVKVFLREINENNVSLGQQFEALTDSRGEFNFNVPIGLPNKLQFDVNDKNFYFSRGMRVKKGESVLLIVTDKAKVVAGQLRMMQQEVNIETAKMKQEVVKDGAPNWEESTELDKILDSLWKKQDTIQWLLNEVDKGTLSLSAMENKTASLQRENQRLLNKIVVLEGRIKILEEDVWQAYLKFPEVHCQGISRDKKTLSFSFKVLDKDYQPVVNRNLSIKVVIEKLTGIRKESKSVPVFHESGDRFYRTLVKPTPYVTISFIAKDHVFDPRKANYRILVYNTLFDDSAKPFINEELWDIGSNCFPEEVPEDLVTNPKKNEVVQTLTVNKQQVELQLRDNGVEDGDIVTLLLNGKPILKNIRLTSKFEHYPLDLQKGENILTLSSVSTGSNGPNTCAFIISDGINSVPGKLSETSDQTQSIKIICR